jgi:hypothetical protein
VYANNPHDLEDLKQNICEAAYSIQQCELKQISGNLFKKIKTCLTLVTVPISGDSPAHASGQHIPYITLAWAL